MANIIDYLDIKGDVGFGQSPINEIDKIILARFSNLPFGKIVFEKKETIENVALKMLNLKDEDFFWKGDKEFVQKIGKNIRYKDLIVSDYSEIKDLLIEKQFAAITIWISNKLRYVSFRGTDTSLVGWKEDFNMAFMDDIPAQKEGLEYLNSIGKKYRGKLIVGGHSKGGNISIYASMRCKPTIRRKILEIINADGPGFNEKVIKSKEYLKILERINTYIPQSSIIGRLLEHEDNYEIVYSSQKGVMQHDIYSWQLEGDNLVRVNDLTDESKIVSKVLKKWLEDTTPNQRENFFNIIYEVLVSTDVKDFNDFNIDTFKKIKTIIKSYKNIEKEERKEIEEMFKLLLESIISAIKDNRKETIKNK